MTGSQMTLFAANLERVYFVCGAALLACGLLWVVHRRGATMQLSWGWLGVFAIGRGLADWVGLGTVPSEHGLVWDVLRIAFLAGSLAALVEFGRRGLLRDDRPALNAWIHLPLVGLAATGALSGSTDWLETTCQWAMGWPGGILALVVLVRAARNPDGRRDRPLLVAASALAAYIVVDSTPLRWLTLAVSLAMVASTWLVVRRNLPATAGLRWLGRAWAPAGLAGIVLVGWLLLGAAPRTDIAIDLEPPADADVPERPHAAAVEIAFTPEYHTPTRVRVWQYTLISLPIVIFFLLFWVGSRLPFIDS